MMFALGIDPGLSGAIALLRNGEYAEVWDMPTMGRGSGSKQQINAAEVARILRECPPCTAYMELVGAMPGQGVSSMFNFGKAAGAVMGHWRRCDSRWSRSRRSGGSVSSR
jgi:crossover junction endodeoxyribonuclease RuvC